MRSSDAAYASLDEGFVGPSTLSSRPLCGVVPGGSDRAAEADGPAIGYEMHPRRGRHWRTLRSGVDGPVRGALVRRPDPVPLRSYNRPDLFELCDALAGVFVARKGIHRDLDYPSGLACHLIGFETALFTPLLWQAG